MATVRRVVNLRGPVSPPKKKIKHLQHPGDTDHSQTRREREEEEEKLVSEWEKRTTEKKNATQSSSQSSPLLEERRREKKKRKEKGRQRWRWRKTCHLGVMACLRPHSIHTLLPDPPMERKKNINNSAERTAREGERAREKKKKTLKWLTSEWWETDAVDLSFSRLRLHEGRRERGFIIFSNPH